MVFLSRFTLLLFFIFFLRDTVLFGHLTFAEKSYSLSTCTMANPLSVIQQLVIRLLIMSLKVKQLSLFHFSAVVTQAASACLYIGVF